MTKENGVLRTEGRKEVRVKVELTMELDGPATNISEGGFCLMVSHPLPAGVCAILSFQLPGNNKPIKCQGRIIWCAKSEVASDTWNVGVKFVDLPEEQQAKIGDFVKEEERLLKAFSL